MEAVKRGAKSGAKSSGGEVFFLFFQVPIQLNDYSHTLALAVMISTVQFPPFLTRTWNFTSLLER